MAGRAATITRIYYKLRRYFSAAEEDFDGNASDLIVFSYLTTKVATDNFSKNNKLGEGGFGTVYKVPFGNSYLLVNVIKAVLDFPLFFILKEIMYVVE